MGYTVDNAPTAPQQSPATTPTAFPVPNSGHVVALAVTLSLVGVLLVAGITFFAVRMRRAKLEESNDEKNDPRHSTILDPRHPASRITPFFNTRMRIARRRQDGGWDFEDPDQSFRPHGVADPFPVAPSPVSSNHWTVESSPVDVKEWDHRQDTNISSRGLEPPPPAYHTHNQSVEGST